MTTISRRPNAQPVSFDITAQGARKTKAFNKNVRMVQGFKVTLNQGTTPLQINLNSSGKQLLGIAIFPVSGLLTTLGDTQVNFLVNNLNLLVAVGANNINPNFVQNMIFFPTPQPLKGNDTISLNFVKNDAGAADALINIFYVPQI